MPLHRLAPLLVTATLLLASALPAAEWVLSTYGHTAIVPMKSAPFPHPSREQGFTRNGKTFPQDPHYNDSSVALFLPVGYQPDDKINFIVYFHGHGNSVEGSLEQFALRQQVSRAMVKAVVVIPQGPKNASDSGIGRLEEENGLRNLLTEAAAQMVADGKATGTEIGTVTLTGHSGAYYAIGRCLHHGGVEDHLKAVYLLDATYGELEEFAAFAERRPKARLASIFTEHLAAENVELMAILQKRGLNPTLRLEHEANDADLKNRLLFLYTTKLDHNGTVKWLEQFVLAGE